MKPNPSSQQHNCYSMKTFFDRSRGTETCFPAGRKKLAPWKHSQAARPQRTGQPRGCSDIHVLPGEPEWELNFTHGHRLTVWFGATSSTQHSSVPWQTPKHHHYYRMGLSRLACPAPLKKGWIIVVTVPAVLQLAQVPLQSPTLHRPPCSLCAKWEQNH